MFSPTRGGGVRKPSIICSSALYASVACAGALMALSAGALKAQEPPSECESVEGDGVHIVVSGIVRDESTGVALPGAYVTFRYQPEEGSPDLDRVTVETDSVGRYEACSLAAFRTARVTSLYRGARGGERSVRLDRNRKINLEVDVGKPAFLVLSVVSEEGKPVEGARVNLAPLDLRGVTDPQGRAVFREIPPGIYEMTIRHIAYALRTDELSLIGDQESEIQVQLSIRAVEMEPITITVTGRDPRLLAVGFYDRREEIEDGYFATKEEIDGYYDLGNLFRHKRELATTFARNQFLMINDRVARRIGFNLRNIREYPFHEVTGIEAFRCRQAPPELIEEVIHLMRGPCNLVVIWTR